MKSAWLVLLASLMFSRFQWLLFKESSVMVGVTGALMVLVTVGVVVVLVVIVWVVTMVLVVMVKLVA